MIKLLITKLWTTLSWNEFIYPAKQRLAGAEKITIVGNAGSGISLTFKTLLRTIGNNAK